MKPTISSLPRYILATLIAIILPTQFQATAAEWAGESSGTFTVSKNYKMTGQVTIEKGETLTLDVKSGVIVTIDLTKKKRCFVVNGKLVLNGSGTFNGGASSSDYTGDRGGFAYVRGQLDINGVTIQNFAPDHQNSGSVATGQRSIDSWGNGGAILITQGGTVNLNSGHIKNCRSRFVTMVRAEKGGSAVNSCGKGGAVYIEAYDATTTYNPNNKNKQTTFNMKGGTIENCRACWGGAVYVSEAYTSGNKAVFNMTGGTIDGCFSRYTSPDNDTGGVGGCGTLLSLLNQGGGAVMIRQSSLGKGLFNMSGGTIKNCSSETHANGVFCYGDMVMTGGTITGCSPRNWDAIPTYPEAITLTTGTGGTGQKNHSCLGGAVLVIEQGSSFKMSGGTISENTASSGAGVFVRGLTEVSSSYSPSKTVFTMSGTAKIINNRAVNGETNGVRNGYGNGAGADIEGATFKFEGGTISGNLANRYGGGINFNEVGILDMGGDNKCEISGNHAYVAGGGISQETGNCTLSIHHTNVSISNNRAGYSSQTEADPVNSSHPAYDSSLRKVGFGGGIFLEFGSLTFSDGTISDNISFGAGGGVSIRPGIRGTSSKFGNIKVNFSNKAQLLRNHAYSTDNGSGGGIDIGILNTGKTAKTYNIDVNISGGKISENTAQRSGGGISIRPSQDGQAVMYDNITVNIDGTCEITNNSTSSADNGTGGGIDINIEKAPSAGSCEVVVNVNGGKLNENHSARSGGAIYCYVHNEIKTYDAIVNLGLNGGFEANGNTAAMYAGAIGVSNGTFNLYSGTIDGNVAQTAGGGIFGNETCVINFEKNITISNNKAEGHRGGGVYLVDGTLNVKPECTSTISGNWAKQVGGGIACINNKYKDSKIQINGNIVVTGNSAGPLKESDIDNTAPIVGGGGIYFAGKTITIANGTFSRNKTNYGIGGGLLAHTTTSTSTGQTVVFSNGSISNNSAFYGGGVAVHGYFDMTMSANIEGNFATNGGGIMLLNKAHLTFGDGIIRRNRAVSNAALPNGTAYLKQAEDISGVGGGVFIGKNTSLSFDDITHLGLYNNIADNAADDIFASGDNTTVTLPNVSNMDLKGTDLPSNKLYWQEDYHNSDPNYGQGTAVITDGSPNYRYQYSLENNHPTRHYLVQGDKVEWTKYACLALGYDLVLVTLNKYGLKKDDSAIVRCYYQNDSQVASHYCDVFLSNPNGDEMVSRNVVLPAANWKFEETSWSWKYNKGAQPVFSPAHDPTTGYITITQTENRLIKITNTEDTDDIRSDAHSVTNILTAITD